MASSICRSASSRVATRSAQAPIRATVIARAAKPASVPQLLAAGVAAGLLLNSPANAAELRMLADVSRPSFSFVDSNKDGVISKDELASMAQQVAQDEELDAPTDELLTFSMRVFDLNQDGKLTTDEMLTGLALDTAVGVDTINGDVVKVFDKNGDGYVDMSEWKAPFGNLGPGGEEVKEFAFKRLEFLSDQDNKLDLGELANALTVMRILVLGN